MSQSIYIYFFLSYNKWGGRLEIKFSKGRTVSNVIELENSSNFYLILHNLINFYYISILKIPHLDYRFSLFLKCTTNFVSIIFYLLFDL